MQSIGLVGVLVKRLLIIIERCKKKCKKIAFFLKKLWTSAKTSQFHQKHTQTIRQYCKFLDRNYQPRRISKHSLRHLWLFLNQFRVKNAGSFL